MDGENIYQTYLLIYTKASSDQLEDTQITLDDNRECAAAALAAYHVKTGVAPWRYNDLISEVKSMCGD